MAKTKKNVETPETATIGATAAPTKSKGAPKKEGLRKAQVRILATLAKHERPMDRKEIASTAPCDLANLVELIGSHDPVKREANDAKHFPSLLTLGYIRAEKHAGEGGKEGIVYAVTANGKKAAAKLSS